MTKHFLLDIQNYKGFQVTKVEEAYLTINSQMLHYVRRYYAEEQVNTGVLGDVLMERFYDTEEWIRTDKIISVSCLHNYFEDETEGYWYLLLGVMGLPAFEKITCPDEVVARQITNAIRDLIINNIF